MLKKFSLRIFLPVLFCEGNPQSDFYVLGKRIFDITFGIIGLVIFSPFMILTAAAIKLYDRGPIIYKQVRLTQNRKEFYVYKFRSMRVDAEIDGIARLASKNDVRVTPIGKFIRAVHIDEMPQVFCILSGNMSVVGPRPERPEIAEQYEKVMPEFALRLSGFVRKQVLPGTLRYMESIIQSRMINCRWI